MTSRKDDGGPAVYLEYDRQTLYGPCGGRVEYVGQRIEWDTSTIPIRPIMVLLFTDHDMQAVDKPELEDGVHYRLEFPLAAVHTLKARQQ